MTAADWSPLQFIDEEITVQHGCRPTLEKKPEAPQAFDWRDQTFQVTEVLSTWFDYGRRGREARNMAPPHAEAALRRGSWGVGRIYFRVRTEDGRAFDLYYDRAPAKAGDRKGHWFLYRELRAGDPAR
jgi:Domain of unknown function (DUF6504)